MLVFLMRAAIWFCSAAIPVNASTPVCVTAAHDDYAIWFHVDAGATAPLPRTLEVPACTCLYHVFYSRERIMQLNDPARTAAYADAVAALLAQRPGARLLQADDGVVLAAAAAEIGGVTVALPHLSSYARRLHAELFRWGPLGPLDARACVAHAYARRSAPVVVRAGTGRRRSHRQRLIWRRRRGRCPRADRLTS